MTNTQEQIDQINNKLDILLDYVNQQRLKSSTIEDLIDDVSIIGKDIYDSTVEELDKQAVEINPDELRILGVKIIKNIKNFNMVIDMFESLTDLSKDAMPIVNEMIIDGTKKLHEYDEKGYFEFINESRNIVDNIITHFSAEDVKHLADNIVGILETVKSLTQPEMLSAMNNAVKIFASMNKGQAPEYSLWKLMKEIRSPEMKKGIGFMVMFMKNMARIKFK